MITGIILAAGESTRMETPKQLLPWKETTILQEVVRNALNSKLSRVLVVLGHRAQEIAASIEHTSVQIVINNDYKCGMSSSLKSGITHASQHSEAFMSILGDEPLIGTDIINLLVDRYGAGNHGIIVPVYNGRRGHPVIFSRKYTDELLALETERGANEILRKHPEDVLEVTVNSENILLDIDTVSEYEKARRLHDYKSKS